MKLYSDNPAMHILLRPLRPDDAEVMAKLANNKNVWDNLRDKMPHPYSIEDADFFIGMTQKEARQVTFGIEVGGEFCGVIGLIPNTDVYRHSVELGYWLGEPYWGRGIATEAVDIITRYAFKSLGLMRVEAGAYEYKIGSMRVLEKCGYTQEGIARKSVIKNGQFYDTHKYAKLKTD